MTQEENLRRQQDEHVKYIKKHLCDKDSKKPFVFISYKSDDWETVLHEVVYTLVKEYGLNVYFDGSFDNHNSLWINQFPQNMNSWYCKGVLAFLDNRYATSYATLMELMHSQTVKASKGSKGEKKKSLPVVPVNLGKLSKVEGPIGEENTYLGEAYYSDNTQNVNAKAEQSLFDKAFEELKDRKILGDSRFLYSPGGTLDKDTCSTIVIELLAYLQVNENRYEKGQSLDSIAASIRDACGNEVFSASPPPPPPPPLPTPPGPSETGTISLPDFLKAYNIKTFLKGTYQKFRLVGRGEGAKYNTEYFDSAKELTWSFVRKVLEDRGQDYISLVVEKNAGKKNPPFITAEEYQLRIKQGDSMKYRRLDVPGLENWAMYKNYGQYSWINDVLCKRILDLGLSLEDFSLEYVPSREADTGKDKTPPSPPQKDSSKGKVTTGGIVKPIRLDGKTGKQNKQPPKTGGYSFSLYGERYEGLILKNMMLTVFKTTLQRHPDQLDLLLDSLPCLREGMTISSNAQPTTFRAGENIEVAGRSISIGTSLNQAAVRQHMKKLMQLCNEPEGTLVIDGDDC